MKTMRMPVPGPHTEMPTERAERLARERALIAEAREDIHQGRVLDDAELDAWLDTLDADENSPPPPSGVKGGR
jgi:hypothetical protein